MIGMSLLISFTKGYSQFSPGELSRAHSSLEGTKQCAQCHDVGKEISGAKCFTCHAPIQRELDGHRGYHSSVSDRKCVSCHKEHLGIDARISLIKAEEIDHNTTGFILTGKHAAVKCEGCHRAANVKDPDVRRSLEQHPRTTYLGLETSCSSCHEDRHQGKLGPNCQSCHTTKGWANIPGFDHSKTKFMLSGRHDTVACSKCHESVTSKTKNGPVDLSTKAFVDCIPCHATPHTEKFSQQTCTSCHSTEGWKTGKAATFNHDLTAYKLVGRHAQVKCQLCHKEEGKKARGSSLKLHHAKCVDCHQDYHEGQFVKTYKSDCAKCHTENGFLPSTFTVAQHTPVFALTQAHGAIPCVACHAKSETKKAQFRFSNISCETCHRDPHKGDFRQFMKGRGCETCHTTKSWQSVRFEHSVTKFVLEGKHADVRCEQCHRSQSAKSAAKYKYKGVETTCQSCHEEVHNKQFAVGGKTECVACHQTKAWQALTFKHDVTSTFKLSGAHSKVQCGECHHKELIGTKLIVHYKPLSGACETCHQGKKP